MHEDCALFEGWSSPARSPFTPVVQLSARACDLAGLPPDAGRLHDATGLIALALALLYARHEYLRYELPAPAPGADAHRDRLVEVLRRAVVEGRALVEADVARPWPPYSHTGDAMTSARYYRVLATLTRAHAIAAALGAQEPHPLRGQGPGATVD